MTIPEPTIGSRPTGRFYGIGVGPGDPELLTIKAVRLIQTAPVIGYFAKAGRRGNARGIAGRWMTGAAQELPLHYPMTTEHAFDSPVYVAVLAAFYEHAASNIAAHLDAGRDVALLSEGDPLFYGSFMHLLIRLQPRYPVTARAGRNRNGGLLGCGDPADDLGRRYVAGAAGDLAADFADRTASNHRCCRHHEAGAKFCKGPPRGAGSRAAAPRDLRGTRHDGK